MTPTPTRQPATVVLLHSSASSARQWQALVQQLQPHMRCLPIELHGHGAQGSWPGHRPLSLADEAALVAAELGREAGSVHVVGHSYGAAVALKLAAQYPGRVRSVVAYEPVLFRLLVEDPHSRREAEEALALGEGVRSRLADGRAHAAAEHFMSYWAGADAWQSLPQPRREAAALRMPCVSWHFDALYGEPMGLKQLAQLRLPMLFATGSRTTAVARRIGELLRMSLPAARHEVLPGLGHMGPITHAALFNPLVVQFLLGHAAFQPGSRAGSQPNPQAAGAVAASTLV
jgi:pimeloyl-ACP methyl ester carboxylesterase